MKNWYLAISLALTASLAACPARAGLITFDPSAAGLPGAAFTFDAIQGVEVSRIDNTFDMMGGLTFVENGLLKVTGATLGGVSVGPGLNTNYTLYLAFNVTGATTSIVLPGVVTGGSLNLFGVAGVSTFGFSGSNVATVDNGGNTPVALFSSSITNGVIGSNLVSPDPLALDLFATVDAKVNAIAPGFITSPSGPLNLRLDAAHPSSTVQVLNGGAVFLVNGGPDVLTFAAVPEPTSLALLGFGVVCIGLLARRRRRAA